MSYDDCSLNKLNKAEEAIYKLLHWHISFNPTFVAKRCDGATISQYQLEGLFGLIKMMRRTYNQFEYLNNKYSNLPKLSFKPGRLCNSYIEGRFSIFRNSTIYLFAFL